MIPNIPQTGHSSNVILELIVANRVLPLGSVGPGFVTLRQPLELPACDAHVAITIDGERDSWPVHLPKGCCPECEEVEVEKAATMISDSSQVKHFVSDPSPDSPGRLQET